MRFTRVTIFFIALILGLGFYQLARYFLAEVEPQTYLPLEEVMVDTAHVLAEIVEDDLRGKKLDSEALGNAFSDAGKRSFEAQIHNHLKTSVGLGAYLTDAEGIVIFDSEGTRTGLDYSRFRDVYLTMRGKYGARSTRADPEDSRSSILYVSAPVGDPETPIGVLSVYKPQSDAFSIISHRRNAILWGIGLIGTGVALLITVVFLWLFRPIGNLTDYAHAIGRGERPPLPRLGVGREVNTLSTALESMREALEGRQFAERYIQTLTHEMKSPLAAIRGAAELLEEDMPEADRERFLANIRAEVDRTERSINRLMELAAVESKSRLDQTAEIDVAKVVRRAIDQAGPLADLARVTIEPALPDSSVTVHGDEFILRAAVTNLLENAIDFSPAEAAVEVTLETSDDLVHLHIDDRGPGIPEFAREKIFDRFYSLRHHTSGRKGSGLGLTLVREAAELHGGKISLEEREPQGTRATLELPLG